MKSFLIKALRWVAMPIVYLLAIIFANYLGKILFNWTFADSGLFYFKNDNVVAAIDAIRELVSYAFGTGLSMIIAGAIAPSHKIGAARTIGCVHGVIASLAAVLCIITGQDVTIASYAAFIGLIIGVVSGWHIVAEQY